MKDIQELFGCKVFNDAVMQKLLTADCYRQLKATIDDGKTLPPELAGEVATAMMDWALDNGATHFTHWFQPMTGVTAEKHESFITPQPGGAVGMEFSAKMLIKGEPDASSFPSGGLRATFEARGYTAWDPSSYAFIKDDTLCIPTAFCSFTGEALDKKTPLLRSMEAINRAATRVLHLLGHTAVKQVLTNCGAEQEYFLIDKELVSKRRDLIVCGRTLFGAKPPKGQEMEDHYSGIIKPRVAAYMKELDVELWKLGVTAKIRHNETAPSQHELAPVFETVNIACDHNQLIMEMMKKVADRHGLVCLLHEKPFDGVNGSGKHNNWSLMTDTGDNLLKPSKQGDNKRFLLFLCAVLKAVDDYQDLLRLSAATAGNDCRLGGSEAPPSIISVFLGDELTDMLAAVVRGEAASTRDKSDMHVGADVIPILLRDTTDRNRTSPFAFTGNRFEFRMVGSSLSIAGPNFVLNTIVADTLDSFADALERGTPLDELLADTVTRHSRIVYNGNNYTREWAEEAAARGLELLPTADMALATFVRDKNVACFERQKVLTRGEIRSRCDILLDLYSKAIRIEAATMLDIASRDLSPAVISCLSDAAAGLNSLGAAGIKTPKLALRVRAISDKLEKLYMAMEKLSQAAGRALEVDGAEQRATTYRAKVIPAMAALRAVADELEPLVGNDYWPLPSYGDLLYSV